MSPGSSTVDENRSSKLLHSMAQRQQKIYKCFPTEVVAVQGISAMTNGEEVVYTITSKTEGCQWGILCIRCTTNQQSWGLKEGILRSKWVLSAGGKWDAIERLGDGQALFTLNQLLTGSSPHRQTQRRAVSVWEPCLAQADVYLAMPVAAAAPSCQLGPCVLLRQERFSLSRNADAKGDNVGWLIPP